MGEKYTQQEWWERTKGNGGAKYNQANNSITDKELLNQFKIIEKLPEQDKSVIKIFPDAFIY